MAFLTHRGFNAVMESFFSTVKNELADQFASNGDAKMELFDYIEVFYNQRRRAQRSPPPVRLNEVVSNAATCSSDCVCF